MGRIDTLDSEGGKGMHITRSWTRKKDQNGAGMKYLAIEAVSHGVP